MRLALFLLVCTLAGCRFGEARFSSDLDVGFDPGGTVFAYLDQRDGNLVEDADPRVVVAMTWIVFDPKSDLNDLDGAALSAMSHEMAVRDTLVLVLDRQGAVDAGEQFSCTKDGDDVVDSNGLDARVHLAPERLTADSSFADLEPIASRSVSNLTIDVAAFDDADAVVAGTFTVAFEAVDGRDPGNAREGTIEGTFRAPLVDELAAESNLALLDSDGLLALPLGPR
ncbi:MAG: hypothetical protein Q8O67_14135 [Deltaproteobacteria bacterium]|nr:hypothetical protein [Deltaproteobacteria bacterium]